MSVTTKDCKYRIAEICRAGESELAMQLIGSIDPTPSFNPKFWKRRSKTQVAEVGDLYRVSKDGNQITLREFDCTPFEDSLRAYVWDDGETILKVQVQRE